MIETSREPIIVGLARCQHGHLGFATKFGPVTYPDGSSTFAYHGRHLPFFWRRWASRWPRWYVLRVFPRT